MRTGLNPRSLNFTNEYAAVGLSLGVFALLIGLEVPLNTAVVAALLLFFQILAGGIMLAKVIRDLRVSWQEFCGFGIAFGSLVTIGLDQVFRRTPIADFAWAIPATWILFSIYKRRGEVEREAPNGLSKDIVLILGVALLLSAAEWFWTFPIAVLLICLSLSPTGRRVPDVTRLIAGLISLIASVFSITSRPKGWWIEDSDFGLYEAISKTLSIWGFRDNINAVATPTRYHWFAYAWSGLIDRLSGAPPWVSNTRIVPLIILVGLVLVIWSILTRLGFSRNVLVVSLLAIGSFDTVQTWGRGFKLGIIASPSQIYGSLMLFTFLFLLILFNAENLKYAAPIMAAIAFCTVGAKVAHGAILAGALIILFVHRRIKKHTHFNHLDLTLVASLIASYLGFYFIIGGGGGSSRGMLIDQVAFVDGVTGDFRPYGILVHWIAAAILLTGMYGAQLFGLFAVLISYPPKQIVVKVFALGVAISGLFSALFLSGEFAVELFFTHASSSVLVVLFVPALIRELVEGGIRERSKPFFLVFASGLIAGLFGSLLPNPNSGSPSAIFLRTLPSLTILIPVIVAVFAMMTRREAEAKQNSRRSFVVLGLLGLLTFSTTNYLINLANNSIEEYPSFSSNFDSRTGADMTDLLEASNWLNENTPPNIVLATNDFCREISSECNTQTDWHELMRYSMQCTPDQVLRTDDCNAGGYQLLTAIVDRRFLAGNYYVGISDGSAIKPWVARRVLDSVDFAKDPSKTNSLNLVKQGVDLFLLRKDLVTKTSLNKFEGVIFENRSYLIAQLSSGVSES